MSKVSLTGSGLVIALLAFGLPVFGVEVTQGQVSEIVGNAIKVISFVMMVIGQARRPDLHFGMIRK